ncbi:putative Bax protein [Vibrio nigripulchritudo MADA3029]|uniref:glucosaminidase domain-containing protein n=1 Tax=Vibrio nigripulchritudo TaxID=28173 RepID=UPI0003B19889|nr:glucosaminidase domain-containing protein [Vibrio nigripulchritudo]CCN49685.1 putative Bax protein [Vibrio nigripulchritudo MADA3020]CCN52053.1 putative Bax protein [Vibrio nigripulchritudo MADA3021]CCN59346.1 putative Bax protein [Vibrio nigripulchritudo MADA3029]
MLKNLLKLIAAVFFTVAILFPFYPKKEPAPVVQQPPVKPLPEMGATPDFAAIGNVGKKKTAFFGFLSPAIAIENHRIQQERDFLSSMLEAESTTRQNPDNLAKAEKLAKAYRYATPSEGITQSWIQAMLLRVNVLPPALVLTQAANESAWGTSRFATQANNYFGQWCYRAGCGLVPLRRTEGATHEVAKFNSAQESVAAYFMNVNRNRAYAELRTIRAELEQTGQDLKSEKTALALTQGLSHYSERGQAYVDELQAMIRHNKKYWSESGKQ